MTKHRWTRDEVLEFRRAKGTMFYYNPEDSNIFIPRQYGFGYSLNYASPVAWIVTAALIGLLLWSGLRR